MKKINLKEVYNKINNKVSSFLNKNVIRFNNIKQFFKDKKIKIKNICNIKKLGKDIKQKIKSFIKNIFKTPKNIIKKEENKLSTDDNTKQIQKQIADEVSNMLKQKTEEKDINKDINKDNNNINVNISNIEHYTRLVDEQVKKLKQEGKTIGEIVQYLSPTAKEEFIKREELIQKNRARKEYLNNKYGTTLNKLNDSINDNIEKKEINNKANNKTGNNINITSINISNIEHYTQLVDKQVKYMKKAGKTTEEIAEYLSPTAREEFLKREELINKNRKRKEYLNNKYSAILENNINKNIEEKQKIETVAPSSITVLDNDSVEPMGIINNPDVYNVIDVDDYVIADNEKDKISKINEFNNVVKNIQINKSRHK